MTTMPNLTFTSTNSITGESDTHVVNPEELVSVTLPHHPAVVNHRLIPGLTAKDWRHRETGWYDEEHRVLAKLGKQYPAYRPLIDEMRLLLYATFVKEAEVRGQGRRYKISHRRFVKEYDKFCNKWSRQPVSLLTVLTIQGPDDYLRLVNTWSYSYVRNALIVRKV